MHRVGGDALGRCLCLSLGLSTDVVLVGGDDHAIWTLQGRHRDMVHCTDNLYEKLPLFTVDAGIANVHMPGKENGQWGFYSYSERTLDRDKFDEFKTRFYELQSWDTATGYPTRAALESLGLNYVADELERNGKLGGW